MNFIYVGRLDELKGIKILFEAWKIMSNDAPKLVVCGTGLLEGWCRKFIADNKIESIKMIGKVDNQEVKRLMALSEALILPSLWYEGFPMTIVEAYSAGCPVIGSDIGNVGCLINDGENGMRFKAGDVIDLIKVVNELKKSKLSIERNMRNWRIAEYLPNGNYSILEAIYHKII